MLNKNDSNQPTPNYQSHEYYDKFYTFSEDSIITEEHVKGFYDTIQVKRPKTLLPREIALYGHLVEDMQTIITMNQTLKEVNQLLTSEIKKKPDAKWLVKKWFTSWVVATLFVGLIASFAQFSLDSDRKALVLENKKLQESALLIENKDLQEQIKDLEDENTKIKKGKSCWLF